MEAVLSAKTSSLCFNKDDFMINDFSVDKFVSNYRKYVSLETLLADLGVYHRILCSAMIELINKDYADFLNLSSNLVGLDKSIKILCSPLGEKIEVAINDNRKKLYDAKTHTSLLFHEYKTAHKKKVLAHHALCVLEGLDKLLTLNSLGEEKMPLDILERIALDYNITHFHMKKASSLKIIKNKEGVIEEIADNLKHHLESRFFESLSTNDEYYLLRVLRICTIISMESEVERLYFETIVKPYMECHITEKNIVKHGLSYVYGKVLDFVKSSALLIQCTQETGRSADVVHGFDFLVNSVFPGIVYSFDYITPVHIYAHGNPEKFHENYMCTMQFLDEFEHWCEVPTSVRKLRCHEAYRSFMNKWNLDVYFQIIFSEIAGKLEKSILQGFIYPKDLKSVKKDSYLLNTSYTLSECVNLCCNEKVFLEPLRHQFFRLILKLIARFYKATYNDLKQNEEEKNPVYVAVTIRDVKMLQNELIRMYKEGSFKDESPKCRFKTNITGDAFDKSVKLLGNIISIGNIAMEKALIKQCCVHLKLISDIPRLYRKTNREIPSKPSKYVALVFNDLTNFIAETDSLLPVMTKEGCLQGVMKEIIAKLDFIIRDVLTSIAKMEHSLKILKRAKDKNPAGSSGFTDDDKIRLQLIIDVDTFKEKAKEIGMDLSQWIEFMEIKNLMLTTKMKLPK